MNAQDHYLLSELPKAKTLDEIEQLLPYKLAPQKITAWAKALNTADNFPKKLIQLNKGVDGLG